MDYWLAVELELADATHRLGPDEADAADVLRDVELSTKNPGGDDEASFVVSRREWATRDALLFAPATIYGPGGRTHFSGRVRDISQVDDDSIRVELEGWAASLDDNESFAQLYLSRDLNAWGEASRARKVALLAVFGSCEGPTTEPDGTTGIPGLVLTLTTGTTLPIAEGWFDAGPGQTITSIYYDYTSRAVAADGAVVGIASDDIATASQSTSDLITGTNSSGTGTLTATTPYRYAFVQMTAGSTTTASKETRQRRLTVFGDSGVLKRGTAPDDGYYGSDIIAHAVATAAPEVSVPIDAIEDSGFIIPHFVHERASVRQLIERVTAIGTAGFSLPDWGVYEREFFWRSPDSHGRTWRVRRDETAIPQDDGPTASERFKGIVIAYQDAAGTTKTVGPPQSGADYETSGLLDSNENNPAPDNRVVLRDIGIITSQEGAVYIGQSLIAEQNALTRRGSVTLAGTVTDEHGNTEPACAVRACDRVYVEDDPDPELLPVNSTSYSHNDATLTANLGAAPHWVDIALAQLAAVLPL